ncbi:MAG: Fic family protein [Lachnospiraceae bacterium]|nr:Fic family protein [Lachnospiraceae bacterium]
MNHDEDIKDIENRIEENRKNILDRKKLSKQQSEVLFNYFRDKVVYSANMLAGSELTLEETQIVLEEETLIKDKSVRDYYLAQGMADAFDLMIKQYNKPIKETSLKKIHSKLYGKVNDKKGGKYRELQVFIPQLQYMPPSGDDVPGLMTRFMEQMEYSDEVLTPLEYAIMCHRKILEIQPYWEGNIQMAIIAANMVLLKNGYGLLYINENYREAYFKAFITSLKSGNIVVDDLVRLFEKCLLETQREFIDVLNAITN